MAPRVMAQRSYRWLEWGPADDLRSACRDAEDRMVFTGSRVRRADRPAGPEGEVVELLARDLVAVDWRDGRGALEYDPVFLVVESS